jgi:hypothetical protein
MGSIDIVRMRRSVRRPLGMLDEDDPDLTNDDVDLYLNRAYWEVQDKFPFREKERRGTFVTQIGVRNYEMPKPFEALTGLSIVDPVSGQHTPLDYMENDRYESEYQEGENFYGTPQFYTRMDCFATLLPTPDKAYTLVLRRKIILTDLSSSNQLSSLPQVWDEILIFGAVWRGFFDFGDFARANQVKAHQVSLLDTIVPTPAKELGDTSRAGLEVLGREY